MPAMSRYIPRQQYALHDFTSGNIDLVVLRCGTTGDGHEWRYVGPPARDYCIACGCSRLEWSKWEKERAGRGGA